MLEVFGITLKTVQPSHSTRSRAFQKTYKWLDKTGPWKSTCVQENCRIYESRRSPKADNHKNARCISPRYQQTKCSSFTVILCDGDNTMFSNGRPVRSSDEFIVSAKVDQSGIRNSMGNKRKYPNLTLNDPSNWKHHEYVCILPYVHDALYSTLLSSRLISPVECHIPSFWR